MLHTVAYGYFCVLVCRKIFCNGQSLFEAFHGHRLNKQICINIIVFLHPAIIHYRSPFYFQIFDAARMQTYLSELFNACPFPHATPIYINIYISQSVMCGGTQGFCGLLESHFCNPFLRKKQQKGRT